MARCYRHAPPIPIRTFDAIHLATAHVAGESELVFTALSPLRGEGGARYRFGRHDVVARAGWTGGAAPEDRPHPTFKARAAAIGE